MSNDCLTKPCSMCGNRIQGGNYYCPTCKICICFGCALRMISKDNYPLKCPMCGTKLQ
ncbi:MAG: hypothetical protein ABSD73_11705 [Candidatus Bathyarchaeia archaeon]